ncbi:hypothetical protein I4U23_020736 [Adineta vaga]|nr:hypothetical protein I4U23_020736 [Adineta vaga]
MSDEYWIIAVPGRSTPKESFEEVCRATERDQLSTNFFFNIPDLKVGTLDSLVALSDDLAKLDNYIEGVTKKLTQYFFHDVLDDDRNRLAENLTVGSHGVDPIRYVSEFQWDHAKYPTKQSLKNLSDIISKASTHIENELKLRSQSYNNVKQNLEAIEKKQTGSLLTRSLNDVIKKEHFVLGSEYLKTVLVCVPKGLISDWYAKYESLCGMIVPRTTELVTQDQDYALFTVTLFQKTEDTFRHKCRENKFTVRDFTFDEKALANEREKTRELELERQKLYTNLVRWLKINFGEIFSASIHIKALRIFVESVLRYGLPVNFASIIIHPNRKVTKRLRDVLDRLFGYLDHSDRSNKDESFDIPGVFSSEQEYYPYVYLKLDLDYIDMKSMASSEAKRLVSGIELVGAGGYDKLQIKQYPYRAPGADEVAIQIKFAGLNFADLMRRQGLYSPAPKYPYVPGFEASGIIEAIGSNVSQFSVGDRVIAFAGDGMWSDMITLPNYQCFKMPDEMSFEEGAAFLVNYITAHQILFEFGNLRPNKSVLVHMAAGGVGIAAIQICKTVENVTVFGTASASKHATIKDIGCTYPIDYRTQDYVSEIRKIAPKGVDIIMDPMNGEDSVRGYNLLKPFGKIIYFGASNVAASGENRSLLTAFKTWYKCFSTNSLAILSENKSIAGYHLGYLSKDLEATQEFASSTVTELIRLYKQGALKPQVDSIYPYSKIGEAMQRMHNRKNVGKILLQPDHEYNTKNVQEKQVE